MLTRPVGQVPDRFQLTSSPLPAQSSADPVVDFVVLDTDPEHLSVRTRTLRLSLSSVHMYSSVGTQRGAEAVRAHKVPGRRLYVLKFRHLRREFELCSGPPSKVLTYILAQDPDDGICSDSDRDVCARRDDEHDLRVPTSTRGIMTGRVT